MSRKNLLTAREVQVLKLLLKQQTSKEIGEKIGLSKRTIEGIRVQLMRKTKSKNPIGLLKWAINNDFVKVNNRGKPKLRL